MTDEPVRYSYTPDFLDQLMEVSNGKAFRKKIEPCPYCEPECGMFEKPKFATEWDKEGIVREVVFIRNQMGLYYKKGYAVMVSACPRCGKLSFHHRDIYWLLRDDWADKEIVQAEIDAWTQESLDRWEASLCSRCTEDPEVDRNEFGYLIECEHGRFPESPWTIRTFRCKHFKPTNPDTCEYCGEVVKGEENYEKVHKACQVKMDKIQRIAHAKWLKDMKRLGIKKGVEIDAERNNIS